MGHRPENPACGDPFERAADPDHSRQEIAGRSFGHGAAPGEYEPNLCAMNGHANVHRQRHGDARTCRRAVDGRNHGLERSIYPHCHPTAAVPHSFARPVNRAIRNGGAEPEFSVELNAPEPGPRSAPAQMPPFDRHRMMLTGAALSPIVVRTVLPAFLILRGRIRIRILPEDQWCTSAQGNRPTRRGTGQ